MGRGRRLRQHRRRGRASLEGCNGAAASMSDTTHDLYEAVVGQERAVAELRAAARTPVHAYLFVGATGVGTREAARAFAADLLGDTSGRALAERHPDLVVVQREAKDASIKAE